MIKKREYWPENDSWQHSQERIFWQTEAQHSVTHEATVFCMWPQVLEQRGALIVWRGRDERGAQVKWVCLCLFVCVLQKQRQLIIGEAHLDVGHLSTLTFEPCTIHSGCILYVCGEVGMPLYLQSRAWACPPLQRAQLQSVCGQVSVCVTVCCFYLLFTMCAMVVRAAGHSAGL